MNHYTAKIHAQSEDESVDILVATVHVRARDLNKAWAKADSAADSIDMRRVVVEELDAGQELKCYTKSVELDENVSPM